VVAGIAIMATGLGWIDPVVSLLIALVIIVSTWGLFTESLELALDAVPRGFDPDQLEAALGRLAGVAEVHDVHVWGPSTSEVSLTVHLVVTTETDRDALLAAAHRLVREEFHVAHATIQIEGAGAPPACHQATDCDPT
jgi:cobalt-zinc-cadmium efflux system protein